MNSQDKIKLIVALLSLSAAAYFAYGFFAGNKDVDEAFFYDSSEKQLFTASRTAVPPIRGLNDDKEDAYRAVVISTNGNPEDKSSWKIAYLERYSPELKKQMLAAQASGTSPAMGRGAAQAHRFVKRVEDKEWHSLNTAEGERIVNEWAIPGPNGMTPVVCAP